MEVVPEIVVLPEAPLRVSQRKNFLVSVPRVAPGFSGEGGQLDTIQIISV